MSLKSYKVNPPREESVTIEKKRNLRLSDLERRLKLRKQGVKRSKPSPMKSVGSMLQSFNRSLSKSVSRMPTGRQINKDLWG